MPSIPPAGVPVSSYPKFNRTPTQLEIVAKLKDAQRLLEEETRHRQIAVDYVETKAMFFGAKVAITNVLHEICVKYQLYGAAVDSQIELPRQGGTLLVWQGAKSDDPRITGAIDDLLTNETPTDGDGNALPSLADIHKVARDQLTILFINIIKYHELQIERSFVLDQIAVLCIKSILLGEAPTPEVINILNDKDLGPELDFPFKTSGRIQSFSNSYRTMGYGINSYYGFQPTPIIDQWIVGHKFSGSSRKAVDNLDAARGNLRAKYVSRDYGGVRVWRADQNLPGSNWFNHTISFPEGISMGANIPHKHYRTFLQFQLGLVRFRDIPMNFKPVPSAPEVYYATDTLVSFYSHSLKTRKPEDFWAMCSKYRLVGELGASQTVVVKLIEVDPKTSAPKGRGTIAGIFYADSYSQAESELGNAVSAVASMYHYILPLVKGEVITTSASDMQTYLQSQTKKAQSMWVGIPDKAAQPYVAVVREKWNWPESFLLREKTGQWANEFKPRLISRSSDMANTPFLQWASNDPKKRMLSLNDPSGNEQLPESMVPLVFGPAKDIPGVNSITQIDFMVQPAGVLDAMRLIATPGVSNPVMQAIKDVFFKRDIVEDTGDSFKVNIIQAGTTTSFEQRMVQVKRNLEVLQVVLTAPYLYLEGRNRALTPTVGGSGRSKYGICISQAEMNFVKSVLDKARWPQGAPKVLYSTPVDDVADIPLATSRMKSALSSTTSSPPKLAPLAELPPINLQTTPSVDDKGNQYVTLTMRNGRGYPLPPPSEELPRTLVYANEQSANGVYEMYTTFNYIWSRDAAGIYTGAKSKIKGTLPDVNVSQRITPQQQELQSLEVATKRDDIAVAGAVSALTILSTGLYLFAKNKGLLDRGD